MRLIREVLPGMRAKRWGRILTIQSVSVKQPLAELLLSNAVRPGVHGMMKTLAGQLGAEGHPGQHALSGAHRDRSPAGRPQGQRAVA